MPGGKQRGLKAVGEAASRLAWRQGGVLGQPGGLSIAPGIRGEGSGRQGRADDVGLCWPPQALVMGGEAPSPGPLSDRSGEVEGSGDPQDLQSHEQTDVHGVFQASVSAARLVHVEIRRVLGKRLRMTESQSVSRGQRTGDS